MLRPQENPTRERKALGGLWSFRLDAAGDGRRDHWQEAPLAGAREMPVPAADPLLGRPRTAGVVLQHLRAVVRLDDDDLALANALADVLRRVAKVGQPRDGAPRGEEVAVLAAGETEAHRLLRVMGHVETFDFQVAKGEP